MIVIAINHLTYLIRSSGYSGPIIRTPTTLGFSSAAEIFLLMSGYMVGMLYIRQQQLTTISMQRAAKLYVFHVLAFVALLVLSPVLPMEIRDISGLQYTISHLPAATGEFLTFQQHPFMAGVLEVYIVLILLTPLAARWLNNRLWLFLTVSFALYALVQVFPRFNLPGGQPNDDGVWDFNPFAWQFLYFIGVAIGMRRLHVPLFNWLGRSPVHQLAPLIAFGIGGLLYILHFKGVITIPFWDKSNLGVVRLLHSALALCAFASVASWMVNTLSPWIWEQVALIGRNTLECYVFSIPTTYALAAIWETLGLGEAGYFTVTLSIVVLIWLVATIKQAWLGGSLQNLRTYLP